MKHETEQGRTEVFRASSQETGIAEIDRLIGCSSLGTPAAKSLRERAPAEAAQAILGRANTLGHGPFSIGIEILPFELSGVITDHQGTILDRRRWPLPDMKVGTVVKHMAKVAKDLVATSLGLDLPHPSIGIGLQLGGPVDTHTGTVIRYENNPTDPAITVADPRYLWENVKLAELVEQETGCRTVLENDTAALAAVEQKFGAGQEHSTYAVILIRDGVGCNVVMENKLLPGPWELGHIIVWPNGRECECGLVGDIESQAGRRAIRAVVGEQAGHGTDDPEWEHAVNLALDNSGRADKALRAFEWAGEAIGRGIAKLVTLLNPSCVVIYAPPQLIEPSAGNRRVTDAFMNAVEKFRQQTFPPQKQFDLVTRRMQPTDGALGAALIALSRLFSVPLTDLTELEHVT
jgi:predicted NBD/HSP70 family sugar kinase